MQCFQTALRVGYIGLGETGHTFTRTWGHHLLLVAVKSSLLPMHTAQRHTLQKLFLVNFKLIYHLFSWINKGKGKYVVCICTYN